MYRRIQLVSIPVYRIWDVSPEAHWYGYGYCNTASVNPSYMVMVASPMNNPITFNPKISTTRVKHIFRVFAGERDESPEPATREADLDPDTIQEVIIVYTDGACNNNGDENAQAGSGIWYGDGDTRNREMRVPGKTQN